MYTGRTHATSLFNYFLFSPHPTVPRGWTTNWSNIQGARKFLSNKMSIQNMERWILCKFVVQLDEFFSASRTAVKETCDAQSDIPSGSCLPTSFCSLKKTGVEVEMRPSDMEFSLSLSTPASSLRKIATDPCDENEASWCGQWQTVEQKHWFVMWCLAMDFILSYLAMHAVHDYFQIHAATLVTLICTVI